MTGARIMSGGMTSGGMTPNPHRGEAGLTIAGTRCLLRPSFTALVAAEEELGPLFALVERAAAGQLRLAEMAALFWHCLAERGDVTREGVGEAVAEHGPRRLRPAASRIAWADPAGRPLDKFGMSGADRSFGLAALRLAALAARQLGWRPGEFWGATPAELAASLAPPDDTAQPLGRDDLTRLMEHENG